MTRFELLVLPGLAIAACDGSHVATWPDEPEARSAFFVVLDGTEVSEAFAVELDESGVPARQIVAPTGRGERSQSLLLFRETLEALGTGEGPVTLIGSDACSFSPTPIASYQRREAEFVPGTETLDTATLRLPPNGPCPCPRYTARGVEFKNTFGVAELCRVIIPNGPQGIAAVYSHHPNALAVRTATIVVHDLELGNERVVSATISGSIRGGLQASDGRSYFYTELGELAVINLSQATPCFETVCAATGNLTIDALDGSRFGRDPMAEAVELYAVAVERLGLTAHVLRVKGGECTQLTQSPLAVSSADSEAHSNVVYLGPGRAVAVARRSLDLTWIVGDNLTSTDWNVQDLAPRVMGRSMTGSAVMGTYDDFVISTLIEFESPERYTQTMLEIVQPRGLAPESGGTILGGNNGELERISSVDGFSCPPLPPTFGLDVTDGFRVGTRIIFDTNDDEQECEELDTRPLIVLEPAPDG